jgi:cleavage and polyadenylation specificity factor subunit 1
VSYEVNGEEGPSVSRARICEPYVALVRVDGSVLIYKVDSTNLELAEEDREEIIKASSFSFRVIHQLKRN